MSSPVTTVTTSDAQWAWEPVPLSCRNGRGPTGTRGCAGVPAAGLWSTQGNPQLSQRTPVGTARAAPARLGSRRPADRPARPHSQGGQGGAEGARRRPAHARGRADGRLGSTPADAAVQFRRHPSACCLAEETSAVVDKARIPRRVRWLALAAPYRDPQAETCPNESPNSASTVPAAKTTAGKRTNAPLRCRLQRSGRIRPCARGERSCRSWFVMSSFR
jgi:hypothetical protein